jgi:hypothetical protein
MLKLVLLLSLLFAPLAASMASVITYGEYARHLVDRKKVRKRAWEEALATFLFFFLVPPAIMLSLLLLKTVP